MTFSPRLAEGLKVLPIILMIAVLYLGIRSCAAEVVKSPSEFSPVTLKRLEIKPSTLEVGATIELLDGLCNNADQTLNVQLYLGAQSVESPLGSQTVNLLTRVLADGTREEVTDTPEGRLNYALDPGCVFEEPIKAQLPARVTPGLWQLKARIVVNGPNGEVQNVTKTSNTFRVNSCGPEC